MKIAIYNDLHIGAPNQIDVKLEYTDNCYYIGDIIDLANCAKSDVLKYENLYKTMRSKIKNWIDGNHSRMSKTNDFIIIDTGPSRTALVHGDFESWGAEKAIAYRSQPHGASFFKRAIIVNAIEVFEKTIGRTASDKMLKALADKAKSLDCKKIICGHMHPKEEIRVTYQGIDIIILKRGRNEIEL